MPSMAFVVKDIADDVVLAVAATSLVFLKLSSGFSTVDLILQQCLVLALPQQRCKQPVS